jgi:hypothetical protein
MGMFDKMAKRMMETAAAAAGPLVESLGGGSAGDMADPVDGWATVAEVPVVDGRAMTYVRPLAMVVEIPDVEPYPAQPMTAFPYEKFPHKGQRLPVVVDRADVMKIVVKWDDVPTGLEAGLEQARAAAAGAAPAASAPAAPDGGDVLSQLERLSQLRASGAITEDEFAALKSRLLTG